MMRLAYICADPGVPVFGRKEASLHVQEVIRALLRRGAQVELFATCLGGQTPLGLAEIPIHALPKLGQVELVQREQLVLAANDGLLAALKRAGHFDLVYERYSLWSFAGMEYAHDMGTPGLLEVNSPLIEEQARHRGLIDHAIAERVAERVFGAATALLAVSESIAAYLRSYPAAWGRIHVVPNGVDPSRFSAGLTPAYPRSPETFTIGFVGSLKPWHGLDILVEAFATLCKRDPGMRLLVIGDGPQRGYLEANLVTRGLAGAAHLPGAVDPAEVPAWLASMDVAVAPDPDLDHFYFFPLKVHEYMASGVPVVASRIGQITNLIEHDVTGLLYSPGNPAALVAALERLRAEPDLRLRLGRAARATVMRHHTWDAVARRILAWPNWMQASTQVERRRVR
jgi:glycosyltransferase involved in cell wall biosynthesis